MPSTLRPRYVALLIWVLLFVGASFGVWRWWQLNEHRVETNVFAQEIPVVMRTEGGLIEVAVVRAQERFSRVDAKDFWGIPLGTTVSYLQAPVYYRYQIELAREWKVMIRGKTCFVQAPELKPSLPVAFDTSAIQKFSRNGWARLNSQENLAALERSMTGELEKRALSQDYRTLAKPAARQTVEEFVRKWLLKQNVMSTAGDLDIVVTFPGEVPSDLVSRPNQY